MIEYKGLKSQMEESHSGQLHRIANPGPERGSWVRIPPPPHMKIYIYLIILGILVYFLLYIFKKLKEKEEKSPYKKREYLLSIPEKKFYEQLKQIISGRHEIFPQVLLSKILKVKASRGNYWKYFNKINRKTVDFVIFQKPNLNPVLVIEYDGKNHLREKRKLRDAFVDNALKSAGIKVLHITHRKNIDIDKVEQQVNELI